MRARGALLAAALAARALGAQEVRDPHAVQPERPTVATHAGTVAPGWIELETGVERDRGAGATTTFSTPTTLKLGLAPRVQLSIVDSWVRTSGTAPTTSGLGDVSLGVKWRLADGLPVIGDLALLPSIKTPTGSRARGTGTGTTDAGLLLISGHDRGPVSVDINVGVTRRSGLRSAAPRTSTLWTISSGFPIAGRLGGAVEVFGLPGTGGPAGQAPVVATLFGPTLLPRRWLEVDAGVIVPIEGPQPHALYAGGVWNIGRLW